MFAGTIKQIARTIFVKKNKPENAQNRVESGAGH